jgi:hypothetical protein
MHISKDRPWTGKPSTTQLLNGTRELYLKIKKEFAVDPQQMVFAIFGTAVHAQLEGIDVPDALREERLHDEYSSGAFDYFDTKTNSLWDFKTYGSFKAAKAIGVTSTKIAVGTYGNGRTKYKTIFSSGESHDRLDLAIQLNDYASKLRDAGYTVDNLFCEILVRDANTVSARSRGLYKNTYVVKINPLSKIWLDKYKKIKYNRLMKALETDILPPPCSPKECWAYYNNREGRIVYNKCQKYCNVWQYCDRGISEHDLTDDEM